VANEIFKTVKSDMQDLTKSFVKDPIKRAEILDGYDSLNLSWTRKPSDSEYTKDLNGQMVLDENNAGRNPMDQSNTAFFDPSLSYFTTPNAVYKPTVSIGKMKLEEHVDIMPVFLSKIEKSPYTYLAIAAHEAGHKIGLGMAQISGFDLSSEYKDLLACYKDSKSIKLEGKQADEALADYFSSEILARQIQKLPKDQRKQAVMSAAEMHCMFGDRAQHLVSCKGSHPESSLRVSGILGANPSIRKILGCRKDSSRFKSCGLKDSILDAPELNSVNGSGVGGASTRDPKTTKSVK
jgi:hypothetical protein